MRVYHPDYAPTWFERVAELFTLERPASVPDGVDLGVLRRLAARDAEGLRAGVHDVRALGGDLLRVDTGWRPADGPGRAVALARIVPRLRVAQVHARGVRVDLPLRWVQFRATPGGTRLLLRLVEPLADGLATVLAVDLSHAEAPDWVDADVEG
ncbi:MAG: hypothetical protein RLZZ299_495 [Pseudomonadota bacterium]